MKLTKEQLKKIIKEELGKIMDEKINLPKISNPYDRNPTGIDPTMTDAEDELDIDRLMRMDPREPDCNLLVREKVKLQAIANEKEGIDDAEWDYLMSIDPRGGAALSAQASLKTAVKNAIAAEKKCKALKVAQVQMAETKKDIQKMVEEELAAVTKGN